MEYDYLNIGDVIMRGDEYYSSNNDKWHELSGAWSSYYIGRGVTDKFMVRRKKKHNYTPLKHGDIIQENDMVFAGYSEYRESWVVVDKDYIGREFKTGWSEMRRKEDRSIRAQIIKAF